MSKETKPTVLAYRNPISQDGQDYSDFSLDSSTKREKDIDERENNTDKDVMLLSYYDLLMFLFIITVNQSLLHLHLLDEKDAFFTQKSPRNIIHLLVLLAIVTYLIFTHKHVLQKDKTAKQKTALIFITTILVTSNVLLLVKSLTPLSLSYLPLAMIGCFLMVLTIFPIQQKVNPKDLRLFQEFDELQRSSNIETIQICIGLLELSAISFELIYDKALTNITIKAFELEAPQLAHYLCMALQILTALFIIGCLIAKKRLDFRKKNSSNNNIIEKEEMNYEKKYIFPPYLDDAYVSVSSTSQQYFDNKTDSDITYLRGKTAKSRSEFQLSKSFMERMKKIRNGCATNGDDDSSYTETPRSCK